jgi:hypothetical protein
MKYLRTFEGHDLPKHFWDDLGIGGRGYSTKPSREEQKEIKKRKMIYGVNNLSDCKECGARSIYPKKHNCDGEDEGTGYLGYSSDKDAIVLGEDEDLPLESMKYLRTFNESMAREDVIDLMYEISDLGYKCSVDTKWSGDGESTDPGQDQWVSNQNYIQLLLVGRPMGDEGYDKVKYSEILPTINRIESFLKAEGYEMDDITVSSINGTGWDNITLKELNDYVEDGKLDISWHQQRFLFNKVK